MATTSFQKSFKLGKEQSDKFIKTMAESKSYALDSDFKSQFKHADSYKDKLRKVLNT